MGGQAECQGRDGYDWEALGAQSIGTESQQWTREAARRVAL